MSFTTDANQEWMREGKPSLADEIDTCDRCGAPLLSRIARGDRLYCSERCADLNSREIRLLVLKRGKWRTQETFAMPGGREFAIERAAIWRAHGWMVRLSPSEEEK